MQAFEKEVQRANERYARMGVAQVFHAPTPMMPVGSEGDGIFRARFVRRNRSVDFVGVLNRGRAVAFDAKESSGRKWVTDEEHVPKHQVDFLRKWAERGGVAFFLVRFRRANRVYAVPIGTFLEKWASRSSVPVEEIEQAGCPEVGSPLRHLDPFLDQARKEGVDSNLAEVP